MKLDFLNEGSDDCPFVRLYEFRSAEIQRIRETLDELAQGVVNRVILDEITPVVSIDGTRLTFILAKRNRGVVRSTPHDFDVMLTSIGWQQCSGLLEPFCEPSYGYQWLCEGIGRIRILVSHSGDW